MAKLKVMKTLKRSLQLRSPISLLVVLVFLALGTYIIFRSFAATTGVTANQLTSGGAKVSTGTAQTASVSPGPNGQILMWITTLVGSGAAPTPSVSGLGLNFTVVQSVTKTNQGSRRLTLLKATVPSTVGSGPLTIKSSVSSVDFAWTVSKASATNLRQTAVRTDGGFVTSYSVSFTSATVSGNAAIAGFAVGNHDDIVPGSGLTKLGQGKAPSIGIAFDEWTQRSVLTLDASWSQAAHSMAIAVEVAPDTSPPPPPPPSSSSKVPLNDLGTSTYLSQFQGGLYPSGSNTIPSAHLTAGLSNANAIKKLDANGNISTNGKYVMISIGMSNTTQEFCNSTSTGTNCNSWTFMGKAAADTSVNHSSLVMVNGAQGGQDAPQWTVSSDTTYSAVDSRLQQAGATPKQVQIVWLKQADASPTAPLPNTNADAYTLETNLGNIVRAVKTHYPNTKMIFLSSRIYAGYATSNLNPEPFAYESGFSVKWLVQAQINQMSSGTIDPKAGDLSYNSGKAPWIGWGPYLWANGTTPRSDGLIWEATDFVTTDYTHPSVNGQTKVGGLLVNFFKTSQLTKCWFLAAGGTCS